MTKARLRSNPVLYNAYHVAFETGTDIDVVKTWSRAKVQEWLTFFMVKSDLESEAMDKARKKAESQARMKSGRR